MPRRAATSIWRGSTFRARQGTIGRSRQVLDTARAARGAGRLSPERLGPRLCRGRRAGLAQLAQVECAQDDAQAARACRAAARAGRLGLRAGRCAQAAAGRHHRSTRRATRPSSTRSSTACCAARGIRNARLRRHRHQRLRRIDAARRLPPRIFRRDAGGCDASPRPAGDAGCDRLQRREILRLGVARSPISAARSVRSPKE